MDDHSLEGQTVVEAVDDHLPEGQTVVEGVDDHPLDAQTDGVEGMGDHLLEGQIVAGGVDDHPLEVVEGVDDGHIHRQSHVVAVVVQPAAAWEGDHAEVA